MLVGRVTEISDNLIWRRSAAGGFHQGCRGAWAASDLTVEPLGRNGVITRLSTTTHFTLGAIPLCQVRMACSSRASGAGGSRLGCSATDIAQSQANTSFALSKWHLLFPVSHSFF